MRDDQHTTDNGQNIPASPVLSRAAAGINPRNSVPWNGKSGAKNLPSLTGFEIFGRNAPGIAVPMGDGHAAHYDDPIVRDAFARLPEFMNIAGRVKDREVELKYVDRFMRLYKQAGGIGNNFKIQPNASASIRNVIQVAKNRKWGVALIEPTFDNLALFAKSCGVRLVPVTEEALKKKGMSAIDFSNIGVFFLVTPNNPTGWTASEDQFVEIADACARNRVTLAADFSFRSYDRSGVDHYAIAKDSGCSWAFLEDTGKTFPTHELKASVISCSNDLKRDINEMVEIDTLGPSKPVLLLLTHMIEAYLEVGIEKALHSRVREARKVVREAVRGTILRPAPCAVDSVLPVEFLEILDDRYNDAAVTQHLADNGLSVLPGRQFFWSSSKSSNPIDRYIRLSLLKDQSVVREGAQILRESILRIE